MLLNLTKLPILNLKLQGWGLLTFTKENLMKRDNRDYVCDLIKRTENKLGIEFHVDWVGFDPTSILWDSASYCVQDKNGVIIFIPRTKERSDLREIVFHELGHAYAHNYNIPKYVTNVFGEFLDMPYLQYQYRILKYYSGDRRIGYISRYAEVNPEEDFAETFSFVVSGRKHFNGYIVDTLNDSLLRRKIRAVRKLLRIS
jgi:hypothetical protein